MVYCELCGKNVSELIETKISGANLKVCPDCTELGTIIEQDTTKNEKQNTKYSTKKSSSTSTSSKKSNTYNKTDSNEKSSQDYFDEVNDLSLNYGEKIRNARNSQNYTQKELSNKMNIKESYLRNIEDEKTQPDIKLQKRLEKVLDIDLSVEDIDY